MNFVLRMAARETRASWRRLLFFFICIAVGVAAIVALRSVIQNVREVFTTEARALIAADVLISTSREWTPEARSRIDGRLKEAGVTGQTANVAWSSDAPIAAQRQRPNAWESTPNPSAARNKSQIIVSAESGLRGGGGSSSSGRSRYGLTHEA